MSFGLELPYVEKMRTFLLPRVGLSLTNVKRSYLFIIYFLALQFLGMENSRQVGYHERKDL